MSEPAIPSRFRLRVKQRLTVLTYAEEHGVKPASRHFGLNYKTVRRWRIRHQTHGVLGLVPRYPKRRRRRVAPEVIPLVKEARLEHRFGAARTRIWLQRVQGVGVATQTIQRLFRDFGQLACLVDGSVARSSCGSLRRISPATRFRSM
jgi:transposase